MLLAVHVVAATAVVDDDDGVCVCMCWLDTDAEYNCYIVAFNAIAAVTVVCQ